MDMPELPKISSLPEPVKKYGLYIVGGAGLLYLLSRAKPAQSSSAPAASGPATPSNPFASSALSTPSGGSVGNTPVSQASQYAQEQAAALAAKAAEFSYWFDPYTNGGIAQNTNTTGSKPREASRTAQPPSSGTVATQSRFDLYQNSIANAQRQSNSIRQQDQAASQSLALQGQKAQQDQANKQKDRDSNIFLNPSTIISKGIPSLTSALGKITGIRF